MINNTYRNNYHTHCNLCNHAKGEVEDYVKKAIELKLDAIGMSDHAPFDFLNEHFYRVRMYEHEYPEYLRQIDDAIKKYSNDINIYRSLEIEYFDEHIERYKKLNKELDYLILGQHYIKSDKVFKHISKATTLEEFHIYKEEVIKAMATKQFKILAHPDIFLFNQPNFGKEEKEISEAIIEAAIKYDVILEFNANGLRRKKYEEVDGIWYRRYPKEEFWKLVAKTNARVIIGADAHHPNQLKDEAIDQAIEILDRLSIEVEEELVIDWFFLIDFNIRILSVLNI